MISPLVLSRQPCMTPGAGHSFGNGLAGSGGGGVGVVVGPGASSGSVVNGCDWAESNLAQPATARSPAHIKAHTAVAAVRADRRFLMLARLRIVRRCAPRATRACCANRYEGAPG